MRFLAVFFVIFGMINSFHSSFMDCLLCRPNATGKLLVSCRVLEIDMFKPASNNSLRAEHQRQTALTALAF